jgi:dihydroorotate dehydrogenase
VNPGQQAKTRRPDFGAVVGGVTLPFCAMNAAGSVTAMNDVRALAQSRSGAVVLHTTTVHPFVHPEFRSLQNPGFDKLAPLARELAASSSPPVVASIAGSTIEEFAFLARAFAGAGAAAVELNLGEAWVEATLAPCERAAVLEELAGRTKEASTAPIWVRLPERVPLPYRVVVAALTAGGARVVIARNEFTGFEKLLLEAPATLDVVAIGSIASGYDVSRAISKGAKAVQVGPTLGPDGIAIFGRLEREMRLARRSGGPQRAC